MPLHLLGKKSWNVYNTVNVERVRRDEADAKAREEAEEQRMQEEDAARRTAILRGETPPPLAPVAEAIDPSVRRKREDDGHDRGPRERKRRRVRGEDETDMEVRYAREDATARGGEAHASRDMMLKKEVKDAPLLDHAGHIQLIPAPDEATIQKAGKNVEREAEKAKKLRRDEDEYTMRFSNAAGLKQGMNSPWYAADNNNSTKPSSTVVAKATATLAEVEGKDVWGNEDPRRIDREQKRLTGGDPMAVMQGAQRQLKKSTADRERWALERAKEVKVMEWEEEERSRQRRKRHSRRERDAAEDEAGLDGFSLDAIPAVIVKGRCEREREESARRRRHHRARSRSRERERRSSRPDRSS